MVAASMYVPARSARLTALAALLLVWACQPSGTAAEAVDPNRHPEVVKAKAGPVADLIEEAAARATRDSRRLIVYVGAGWCEPCTYFLDAVEADALPERFDDLRFLKFDYDQDETRLSAAGYGGKMIPRFILPGHAGSASDRGFEGSIKGPRATEDLIPKLDWLLSVEMDAR